MRPKFRAWSKTEKIMSDVKKIDFCNSEIDARLFEETAIEEVVLMQSTGLFDRNGQEIFEGDIVKRYKSPFFKAEWEYQIETVIKEKASLLLGREFGKNFGTIPFDSPFAKSDLLEVIGNIYENPEVLEVTE